MPSLRCSVTLSLLVSDSLRICFKDGLKRFEISDRHAVNMYSDLQVNTMWPATIFSLEHC